MQEFINWLLADYNRIIALVAVLGGAIGAILAPFIRFPLQLRAVRNQEKIDNFSAAIKGLEATIRALELLCEQKDTRIRYLESMQTEYDKDRIHWHNTRGQFTTRIEELEAERRPWPDTPTDSSIIILVEDDSAVARAIVRMMQRAGYELFVATRGYDGLRHLRSGQFKLMILDFGLPDINGIDMAILARREGIDIPIIGLTGVAGDLPLDSPRIKEANFVVVMPKTSRADEIIEQVKAVLSPP